MPRTAARATQADIHRAIRAVEQSGADMVVEVLRDGTIRISRKAADDRPKKPVEASKDIRL